VTGRSGKSHRSTPSPECSCSAILSPKELAWRPESPPLQIGTLKYIYELFEKALVGFGYYHLDRGNNGNEFDFEKSAWTYRPVSNTQPFEAGYGPLGLEGGIAKEKAKMTLLWQELAQRGIPLSVVVYPYPAQIVHDTVESRQVRIWREWCEGKCRRFITVFPEFFAAKEQCSRSQPGCWYLKYFIFGDIHYNGAGNALVAEAVSRSLSAVPVIQRESQATAGHSRAEQSEQAPRPAGRPRH
jgi:hypothetical protein